MVSFSLDAVKFLLIYRYLQNIYWFKRGNTAGRLSHELRLSHCLLKLNRQR